MAQKIMPSIKACHLCTVQHAWRQVGTRYSEGFIIKMNAVFRYIKFLGQIGAEGLYHRADSDKGCIVLHRGRARSPCATARCNTVAVPLNDPDSLIGNASLIRQKLGVGRLMPLSVGLRADENVH